METDLSVSSLQSGFVVAVIIGAVLLANHLGGSAGLMRKIAQVALGLALMMLVFTATTVFHGGPSVPPEELAVMFDSDIEFLAAAGDSAGRNADVGTIHIGLGIIFVALGVVLYRKLGAITPGLMLGGLLLILLVNPDSGSQQSNPLYGLYSLLGSAFPGSLGDAGTAREIARFAVLALGTLLLAGLLCCWGRDKAASDGEASQEE